MNMAITSKKQSQAKSNWMRENSKIFSVRVMKNTEADIYNYLTAQEKPTTVIKEAIKEYMQNHPEESEIPWEEQI